MGGGKKKQPIIGYKYLMGMHHIFCHGPIDYVSDIRVDDDKFAFQGKNFGTQISINKPELFGGDEKEGGIVGDVDIEFGDTAQLQNDYLQSVLDPDVPAYRGVAGAVLRQPILGNSPYLKKWQYRGTRIWAQPDGSEQWLPNYAEIVSHLDASEYNDFLASCKGIYVEIAGDGTPSGFNVTTSVNTDSATFTIPEVPNADGDGNPPEGSIYGRDNFVYRVSLRIRAIVEENQYTVHGSRLKDLNEPGASTKVYVNKELQVAPAGMFITLNNGVDIYEYWLNHGAVDIDDLDVYDYIMNFDAEPGTTYTLTIDNVDGEQRRNVNSYSMEDDDPNYPLINTTAYAGNWFQIDGYSIGTASDMNPIHIVRECLLNTDWGLGYSSADIDDTSFEAAAKQIYYEGLGVSLLWNTQTTVEAFIREVLEHIDASLYVSRDNGTFVLKLIRDDYDIGSLITLDESNISKIDNPVTKTFGELQNAATVNYWSQAHSKNGSVTVTDPALVQMQGTVIGAKFDYKGFTNRRNALIAAQRDLRTVSLPMFSATIYTDDVAEDLNIGDTFLLDWDRWQISQKVMRVREIAFGDGKSNSIRIKAVEDVFATPTIPVFAPAGPGWTNPSVNPTVSPDTMAAEVPYYVAVVNTSQSIVDDELGVDSTIGFVVAAAAKPSGSINARVNTDDGSGYVSQGLLDYCGYATLEFDIGPTDTVVDITNAQSVARVDIGSFVQIGKDPTTMEICRVDAISTTSVTLGRGCLDTTPRPHSALEPLFFWEEFRGISSEEFVDSESIDVKVTPITGRGELAIGSAVAETVIMNSRMFRPYAPAQFQINSTYYPTGDPLTGLLTITWVERNRKTQTSETIYDYTDADITDEAGGDYILYGYIDGVLFETQDPATSGATWTPPVSGEIKIEVYARRDSVLSFQPAEWTFNYISGDDTRNVEESDDFRETSEGDIRILED